MKKFFAYSILSLSFLSIIYLPEANAHSEKKYNTQLRGCDFKYHVPGQGWVLGIADGDPKRTRNQMAVVNGGGRYCKKVRNHTKGMAKTGIHGPWYIIFKNNGLLGDI